jgi:amidohydrolase
MDTIDDLLDPFIDELVAFRHDLHRHPELAYHEKRTSEAVAARLADLPGMSIKTGVAGTGIVATLDPQKSGPCIALRADMDALPIEEQTGKPYSSTRPGVMHACGHDGHTTALLGAAMVLSRRRDSLPGPVKFLFQPAEEGGAGALQMCDHGALEDPVVSEIYGFHCWPTEEEGTVCVSEGPVMASSTGFEIKITGTGGHAALPHLCTDPVVVASHCVIALQTIVSRTVDPLEPTVVTIGEVRAGMAPNVIPHFATLRGTLRTMSDEARVRAYSRIVSLIEHTCAAFGAKAEVTNVGYYPVLQNHDVPAKTTLEAAKSIGAARIKSPVPPAMTAEDFSFYLQRVPGAFWFLGVKPPGMREYPKLHMATFDFNDEVLPVAVKMHCEIVRHFFERRST